MVAWTMLQEIAMILVVACIAQGAKASTCKYTVTENVAAAVAAW